MKLSTRVRYGLRLMLDLAMHWGTGPIRLKDIAARQAISQKYLQQLVIPLEAARMVRSVRGAQGGYLLNRSPSDICLLEIVEILGGPMNLADCVENSQTCPRSNLCATQAIWRLIANEINKTLKSKTLQDLADLQLSFAESI